MDILNRLTRVETSGAPEVNTTQARQGVTGHNVRYVLMTGLVGVVIGFAIAYWAVSSFFG